jgi:hypothetical protein
MNKSKQQLISELLQNPYLTSDWIETATTLVDENPDILIEELAEINSSKLLMVNDFIKYLGNAKRVIDFYKECMELNETQLQVILKALEKGLKLDDIFTIVHTYTPYAVMNYILAGVAEGFNQFREDRYLKYTPDQLAEVYSGLKDGIDTNIYDKESIPAEYMQIARHALTIGLKVDIDEENKLTIY